MLLLRPIKARKRSARKWPHKETLMPILGRANNILEANNEMGRRKSGSSLAAALT